MSVAFILFFFYSFSTINRGRCFFSPHLLKFYLLTGCHSAALVGGSQRCGSRSSSSTQSQATQHQHRGTVACKNNVFSRVELVVLGAAAASATRVAVHHPHLSHEGTAIAFNRFLGQRTTCLRYCDVRDAHRVKIKSTNVCIV